MVLISDPETLSMECPSVSLSCVFTCVIWFQKAEMVMAKMLQKPAITMLLADITVATSFFILSLWIHSFKGSVHLCSVH